MMSESSKSIYAFNVFFGFVIALSIVVLSILQSHSNIIIYSSTAMTILFFIASLDLAIDSVYSFHTKHYWLGVGLAIVSAVVVVAGLLRLA